MSDITISNVEVVEQNNPNNTIDVVFSLSNSSPSQVEVNKDEFGTWGSVKNIMDSNGIPVSNTMLYTLRLFKNDGSKVSIDINNQNSAQMFALDDVNRAVLYGTPTKHDSGSLSRKELYAEIKKLKADGIDFNTLEGKNFTRAKSSELQEFVDKHSKATTTIEKVEAPVVKLKPEAKKAKRKAVKKVEKKPEVISKPSFVEEEKKSLASIQTPDIPKVAMDAALGKFMVDVYNQNQEILARLSKLEKTLDVGMDDVKQEVHQLRQAKNRRR